VAGQRKFCYVRNGLTPATPYASVGSPMKTESDSLDSYIARLEAELESAKRVRDGMARLGTNSTYTNSVTPRRTMSAAARERLAAVARARWKKAKAAGKKGL
jgi:hypothetical protein